MRKRFIYFLIPVFVSVQASAQKTTITDLINMSKCSEFKCFNEYALKEGFILRDSVHDEQTMYSFFPDSNPAFPPPVTLNIQYVSPDSVECGISTFDKKYFLLLKRQMEKEDFVKSYTDPSDTITITNWYKSDSYPGLKISVIVEPGSKNEKDNEPDYYSIMAHTW